MRKFLILSIIMILLLMTGCSSASHQEDFALPFHEDDIVKVEAYDYPVGFMESARKKTAADQEDIQYLYSSLSSIPVTKAKQHPDQSGTTVSAFRFCLADGSFYEVVYEGYGVKNGILTTQDMQIFATAADINGLWQNLSTDAKGCGPEELPVPFREETVPVTTLPAFFTGPESEVHQLVFDYLSLKQVDFVSEVDHSTADYFIPELRESLEDQLFWKVFRFEKLVRASISEKILWEEFDIGITDISIDANTASVTAYDTYEYELSEANGTVSSRGTGYTFVCKKVNDRWLIAEIETDNELIEGHVQGYSAQELPKLAGLTE